MARPASIVWLLPTLLVALLVLNPLACIIHCAFAKQPTGVVVAGDTVIFICHMPSADATDPPEPLPPDLLQRLYTLVPPLLMALPLIVIITSLPSRMQVVASQHCPPPPAPPPR